MAVGTWNNPYGALGGGFPSTGDLTMFGGPPASTAAGAGGMALGPWMFASAAIGGIGSWMGARAQAAGMRNAAAQSRAQAAEDRAHNARMQQWGLKWGLGRDIDIAHRQDMYDRIRFRREKDAKKWAATTLTPMMSKASMDAEKRRTSYQAYGAAPRSLRRQKNLNRAVQSGFGQGSIGTMSTTTPWGTQHSFPIANRKAFIRAQQLFGA